MQEQVQQDPQFVSQESIKMVGSQTEQQEPGKSAPARFMTFNNMPADKKKAYLSMSTMFVQSFLSIVEGITSISAGVAGYNTKPPDKDTRKAYEEEFAKTLAVIMSYRDVEVLTPELLLAFAVVRYGMAHKFEKKQAKIEQSKPVITAEDSAEEVERKNRRKRPDAEKPQ